MKRIVDGVMGEHGSSEMEPLPRQTTGVFETMLLRHHEPLFWAEHWSRLEGGCRWCELDRPVSEAAARAAVGRLARENQVGFGVARLIVWRMPTGKTAWQAEVSGPRPHLRKPQLAATWGPALSGALDGRKWKHLGRELWLDALQQARAMGADEALLVDEAGGLVEGCISNVFLVHDHRLLTPDIGSGLLPGIVRGHVLALAIREGLRVREGTITVSEVESATEIWLTNSLLGIRPLARLAGRMLPSQRPFLQKVRSAWQEVHGWDPVDSVTP